MPSKCVFLIVGPNCAVGRVLKSVSKHCEQQTVQDNGHLVEVSRRLAGVTMALAAGCY